MNETVAPPVQNETILCIATRVWDSLWRDSQQIMSRMARHNRVLYFEPGRDPDRSVGAELWRNLPNFATLHCKRPQKNLTVISSPSTLPYARRHLPRLALRATLPLVASINVQVLTRHIHKAMEAFDVESPILWLYEPRHVDLIDQFGEKLVCYFNYDEYADFTGNERIREQLREYDNDLTRRADTVFATSSAQWERRKQLNQDTHFVPNGVDFDMFHRALQPDLEVPDDISEIPGPIIGYAGWLGYQLDANLFYVTAQSYPNCSLVLVGPDDLPDRAMQQTLADLPNVYFLGRKERHELAAYLQVFDVALMPYILDGHNLSAYPLKLHEYLAAGRAIVSTALPELRSFDHVVRIGETKQSFIRQIGEAIQDQSAEAIEERVAVARQNTWDERVAKIYRVLQSHIEPQDSCLTPTLEHVNVQALERCVEHSKN